MMRRNKESAGPQRPEAPSWLVGAMIGMAVSSLATGAIMLGAGMAIGQAATRGK